MSALTTRWKAFCSATVVAAVAGASLTACGSSSSSSASATMPKDLTIGLSAVLSGPYSAYKEVTDGAIAYFKSVNDAGGVEGHTFRWKQQDNAYQAQQSVTTVRDLSRDNPLAILVAGTPGTLAAKGVAKQVKTPIFGVGDGALFTPPITNFFGLNPIYKDLAEGDIDWMMKQPWGSKVALSYQDDAVGQPLSKSLGSHLAKEGKPAIAASVPIDPATTDFSAMATRLKNSGATAVEAFMSTALFVGLQKAAAAIGYHPTWLTLFTQLSPSYTELAGSLANGVYVDGFFLTQGDPMTQFQTAMKKYDPKLVTSSLAQQGWTIGSIIVQAIKDEAATGKPLTQQSFMAALNKMKGVPAGLMPSVTYDAKSHASATKFAVWKYDGATAKQATDFMDLPTD